MPSLMSFAVPALIVVVLEACGRQATLPKGLPTEPQPPTGVPTGAEPVATREVLAQPYSGVADPRQLVIRDAAAWQAFWQEAVRILVPAPSAPDIDFASEMVIAVSLGQRPTGGYDVSIDEVYEANGQLFVVVRDASPAPDAIVTQAITAPVAAVALRRSDAPVVFVLPNP